MLALESACIPVPSEAIMLFAGFSVSEGNLTLFGIVAAGVLGNLIGQSVGDNWEHRRHQLGYLDYVVLAAIAAGVAYWIVKRRRSVSPAG